MSPIVATIFMVDRIIGSLFGDLVRVLCTRTGKSNFDVARFVSWCAVLLVVTSMVLLVIYGLFSRRLEYQLFPLVLMLPIARGFSSEFQKLPVIATEVSKSVAEGIPLSQFLFQHWRTDRMKRTFFFMLGFGFLMLPIIIILRGSKLDLADVSFILLSIFLLMWSFYFYVLYHPLSVPLPTETEK